MSIITKCGVAVVFFVQLLACGAARVPDVTGGGGGGGGFGGSTAGSGAHQGACDVDADCGSEAECTVGRCEAVDGQQGACVDERADDGTRCADGIGFCNGGACIVRPPLNRLAYTWTGDDGSYPFDGHDQYAANLVSDDALVVRVPGVRAGDKFTARITGLTYVDTTGPDTACDLQIHATSYRDDVPANERPIEAGGHMSFLTDVSSGDFIDFEGAHRADSDGNVRVRLLGRAATPGARCGVSGPIELVVIHHFGQ